MRPSCKPAVIHSTQFNFYFLSFPSQYIPNMGTMFLPAPSTLKALYLCYYAHTFPEVRCWKNTQSYSAELLIHSMQLKAPRLSLTWLAALPQEGLTEPVFMYVIYPTIINFLREWHPEEPQLKYTACTWNLTFCIRFLAPRCVHGGCDTFIFLDCSYTPLTKPCHKGLKNCWNIQIKNSVLCSWTDLI